MTVEGALFLVLALGAAFALFDGQVRKRDAAEREAFKRARQDIAFAARQGRRD